MVEPEITFADLDDVLNLSEGLLKYVIKRVTENNLPELEYLEKYNQNQLVNKLKQIISINFTRITYTESLEILENSKSKFIYNEIK
jgi:asparaginyl-tRNA synthetase